METFTITLPARLLENKQRIEKIISMTFCHKCTEVINGGMIELVEVWGHGDEFEQDFFTCGTCEKTHWCRRCVIKKYGKKCANPITCDECEKK